MMRELDMDASMPASAFHMDVKHWHHQRDGLLVQWLVTQFGCVKAS
jgi:hypothetical protein